LASESERQEAVRQTNELASDPSQDRRSRALSIYYLFRIHIRPGFKSADCRRIMGQAKWLDEVNIQPVRAMGSYLPVDRPAGCSAFSMAVFPDRKGWSDWFIYFTLSGLEPKQPRPWEECRKKALDFLKGDLPDTRVRLHEFALCYPREERDKTEKFTGRGVGLHVYDN
jgi:hypothetical protein